MEYVVPVLLMKAKVDGVVSYPLPSMVDYSMIAMSAQELMVTLEPSYSSPEAIKVEVSNKLRELSLISYYITSTISIITLY
jgi:hypothetical protein